MQNRGFEEEQANYAACDPQALIGQFRRFGEAGPAYEIVRLIDAETAWIQVVCSEEELGYPISEILQDPVAETIP
jgi:hypothetical protein